MLTKPKIVMLPSVELKLMPMAKFAEGKYQAIRTVLDVDTRNRDFTEKLLQLNDTAGQDIPELWCNESREPIKGCRKFENPHYGQCREHGQIIKGGRAAPIKSLTADQLLSFWSQQVYANPVNHAIWMYLNAVPRETKVALYFY